MMCEKCGQNIATTIFKQSINGHVQTLHICDNCAIKIGYNNLFDGFNINYIVNDLLNASKKANTQCPSCGITLDQISKTGKVGCASCYSYFNAMLTPAIEKIHGRASHTGKSPLNKEPLKPKTKLCDLSDKLQEAIRLQDFEQAAILRDEIAKLNDNI
ncbi:MAG: UvrB/UvrC motif-containing protein [Oscillospiraceae bacterium]